MVSKKWKENIFFFLFLRCKVLNGRNILELEVSIFYKWKITKCLVQQISHTMFSAPENSSHFDAPHLPQHYDGSAMFYGIRHHHPDIAVAPRSNIYDPYSTNRGLILWISSSCITHIHFTLTWLNRIYELIYFSHTILLGYLVGWCV